VEYSDPNFGLKIFRPKNWPENIQTIILEWKYSDQNFGVKIFRPKNWRGNIQTKILAK
jgi:hypothetical protein